MLQSSDQRPAGFGSRLASRSVRASSTVSEMFWTSRDAAGQRVLREVDPAGVPVDTGRRLTRGV
jgi:hypothetical protein